MKIGDSVVDYSTSPYGQNGKIHAINLRKGIFEIQYEYGISFPKNISDFEWKNGLIFSGYWTNKKQVKKEELAHSLKYLTKRKKEGWVE